MLNREPKLIESNDNPESFLNYNAVRVSGPYWIYDGPLDTLKDHVDFTLLANGTIADLLSFFRKIKPVNNLDKMMADIAAIEDLISSAKEHNDVIGVLQMTSRLNRVKEEMYTEVINTLMRIEPIKIGGYLQSKGWSKTKFKDEPVVYIWRHPSSEDLEILQPLRKTVDYASVMDRAIRQLEVQEQRLYGDILSDLVSE